MWQSVSWRDLAADLNALGYSGCITIEANVPEDEMTAQELEAAYASLPPAGTKENTIGQRLSRYAVQYFRGEFAAALGG